MSLPADQRKLRILLLNPNSSQRMTEGMRDAAAQVLSPGLVDIDTYTGPPSSPPSINDASDINASALAVLADLRSSTSPLTDPGRYDAVLVACFSVHTLVDVIPAEFSVHATGIFEASVLTALSVLPALPGPERWGIVTTGKFWEDHLRDGVNDFLGCGTGNGQVAANRKFAGVFSTGLNAGDFHSVPPEQVTERLKAATKSLLNTGKVTCVVMGCGGMAGLEDIIRETAVEVYGKEEAKRMLIVDGVKAGVLQLDQATKARRAFQE